MKNIGFAKAIRFKEIDEILSKKHSIFVIYGFLIYNASIGIRTVKINNHEINLQRNQLITTKRGISKKLNLPSTTVFDGLEYLKKAGVIEMESGTHSTLITIAESQNEQQEVQPVIENIPDQPLTTPPKAKTKKIKKDSSEIVLSVFDYYIETINPLKKYVKKQAAKNNIELHLKKYSAELLISTIDNYKTELDGNIKEDSEWRKGPSNFFGVKGENRKFFLNHLPSKENEAKEEAYIQPLFTNTYTTEKKEQKRLILKAEADASNKKPKEATHESTADIKAEAMEAMIKIQPKQRNESNLDALGGLTDKEFLRIEGKEIKEKQLREKQLADLKELLKTQPENERIK